MSGILQTIYETLGGKTPGFGDRDTFQPLNIKPKRGSSNNCPLAKHSPPLQQRAHTGRRDKDLALRWILSHTHTHAHIHTCAWTPAKEKNSPNQSHRALPAVDPVHGSCLRGFQPPFTYKRSDVRRRWQQKEGGDGGWRGCCEEEVDSESEAGERKRDREDQRAQSHTLVQTRAGLYVCMRRTWNGERTPWRDVEENTHVKTQRWRAWKELNLHSHEHRCSI